MLATLRAELFRSLLLQKIEFFDVHSASKLTNLISTELDSVRSFIFRNVSRDRGPRAILEASTCLEGPDPRILSQGEKSGNEDRRTFAACKHKARFVVCQEVLDEVEMVAMQCLSHDVI